MPSINTAYFAMLPQIYKSISEKQNKKQKLYIKVINALGSSCVIVCELSFTSTRNKKVW